MPNLQGKSHSNRPSQWRAKGRVFSPRSPPGRVVLVAGLCQGPGPGCFLRKAPPSQVSDKSTAPSLHLPYLNVPHETHPENGLWGSVFTYLGTYRSPLLVRGTGLGTSGMQWHCASPKDGSWWHEISAGGGQDIGVRDDCDTQLL